MTSSKLALIAALLLSAPPGARAEERFDLRPRARVGLAIHVEASVTSRTELTLSIPNRDIAYRRVLESRELRHYTDAIEAIKDGRVTALSRRYTRQGLGAREHPNAPLRVPAGPLQGQSLELRLAPQGGVLALDAATALEVSRLPFALRLNEPFEAGIRGRVVAIGERWQLDQRALERFLDGSAGARPRGAIRFAFDAVRREPPFPARGSDSAPPERVARVSVRVEIDGRVDGRRLALSLDGLLRFSLDRRHLLSVALSGTTRLEASMPDGQGQLAGPGTLSIAKRFLLPSDLQRGDRRWRPARD